MTLSAPVRSILLGVVLIAVSVAGVMVGQNKFGQPKSVIHVVALKWKTESTPEQRQKAIDGIKIMAEKIPGIKNIWIKPIRVQPPEYNANFAIEFVDEAACEPHLFIGGTGGGDDGNGAALVRLEHLGSNCNGGAPLDGFAFDHGGLQAALVTDVLEIQSM